MFFTSKNIVMNHYDINHVKNYTYIHTHTYVCIYIHTYICMCVCVCYIGS